MNDDGSFNCLVGATDLGTGSDTVLGQMAAEVLGVPLDDIIMYSSDTDFTPFDKGAYASSTTYISGAAVVKAAEKVAEQIKAVAASMLQVCCRRNSPGRSESVERRWPIGDAGAGRVEFAASRESTSDHGRWHRTCRPNRRRRLPRNLPK